MQFNQMPCIHFVVIITFLLANQKQVEGMKRKKDDPSMDTNAAGSSKKRAAMKEPDQQMEKREQHSVEVTDEEQHLLGLQYDQIELRSNVWKICIAGTNQAVFNKLNKDEAECAICKGNKENKFIIKTPQGSTSNLITHLKSIHKYSEECKHFLELERAKKEYAQTMQINTTLEEKETRRTLSNIWNICISGTNQKIFNPLDTEQSECLLCKGKGGRQYIFKTANFKTSNLIRHLKNIHNGSDECKQYLELEHAKEDRHSSLQIDQPRISVKSQALLQLTPGNQNDNQQVMKLPKESSSSNVLHPMSAWSATLQRDFGAPNNHAHQHHIVVGSSDGLSLAKLPRRDQLMQSSSGSSNSPTATSLTIIPDNGIVVFKQIPGGLGIWMSKIRIHNHGTGPQKFNVESTNSAVFNIIPEEYNLEPDNHATVDLTFEGDNFESVTGSKFFVQADDAGNENIWTFEARIE